MPMNQAMIDMIVLSVRGIVSRKTTDSYGRFMARWADMVQTGNETSDQAQRPSWISPYSMLVPQWVDIINTKKLPEKYGRVVVGCSC
jgi:hypothetical protein